MYKYQSSKKYCEEKKNYYVYLKNTRYYSNYLVVTI